MDKLHIAIAGEEGDGQLPVDNDLQHRAASVENIEDAQTLPHPVPVASLGPAKLGAGTEHLQGREGGLVHGQELVQYQPADEQDHGYLLIQACPEILVHIFEQGPSC